MQIGSSYINSEILKKKNYIEGVIIGKKPCNETSANKVKKPEGMLPIAAIGSLTVADFLLTQIDPVGVNNIIHEGGHALAAKVLFNADTTIQVDSIDNLKNLLKAPCKENIDRLISGYDINGDKAKGTASINNRQETIFTQLLGPEKAESLVAIMGQVSMEAPQLLNFLIGFKIREKHPIIGYSLMAGSAINHFVNSMYPISTAAMMGSSEKIELAVNKRDDFAKFFKFSGIHPLITATIFTAILPLEFLLLSYLEKKQKEKEINFKALKSLIDKGAISDKRILELRGSYPYKEKLEKAESELNELLETPVDEISNSKDSLKNTTELLNVQNKKFCNYLIEAMRPEIEKEKEILIKKLPPAKSATESWNDLCENTKKKYSNDKIGTTLEASTIIGQLSLLAKTGFDSIKLLLTGKLPPVSAGLIGGVLNTLVPAVGVVGVINNLYQIAGLVKNKQIKKGDKIVSILARGFSAMVSASMFLMRPFSPWLCVAGVTGSLLSTAYICYNRDNL